MAALAFGAIVEHAGLLKRIVDPIAARVAAIPALIAFFCLLSPLMTIAIAVLGVRMLRTSPAERPAPSSAGESPR